MESITAIREIRCVSWDDFKKRIMHDYAEVSFPAHGDSSFSTYPIFRGHANPDWGLSSLWERHIASVGKKSLMRRSQWGAVQDTILNDFKDLAYGSPGLHGQDFSEADWWAIGRHYGLMTPLLDWTRSPYVAAFFAFTGFAEMISPGLVTGTFDPKPFLTESARYVTVWALRVGPYLEPASNLEILNPHVDLGHRQRAQRGVFSRLDHDTHLTVEEYLHSVTLSETPLRKYLIPSDDTARALSELRLMNITFATMFPDLNGAAYQANFEIASLLLLMIANARSNADEIRDSLESSEVIGESESQKEKLNGKE